jgi:uncharacterized protein YecA (UPF0149 family)
MAAIRGVMADPAVAWRAFLASPNAPKTALSPLELDGYLTGIIVAPQSAPIMPSRWLAGLWGEDEPVEDERTLPLVRPFVGFFEIEDQEPFELRDDADELLDEDAAVIPHTILALRKLAQVLATSTGRSRPGRPGRNEPCPCGSGQKYKRCCGRD